MRPASYMQGSAIVLELCILALGTFLVLGAAERMTAVASLAGLRELPLPCHAGEQLPLEETAGLAVQIAEGLAQLHSHHIVHGSLKPSNILLDKLRHDVVLSDFAISAALYKLPEVPAVKVLPLYT